MVSSGHLPDLFDDNFWTLGHASNVARMIHAGSDFVAPWRLQFRVGPHRLLGHRRVRQCLA
jgi:hypothetical protein